MTLVIEKFFKSRLLNSKISVFLATAMSVLIMCVLGIIAINYHSLEDSLRENISFNLLISNDIKELETQQLMKSLTLLEGVKSVNYISKEASAMELMDNLGEDFIKLIGENPLNNIIELKYYADYLKIYDADILIQNFNSYTEIEDVLYDQNIIQLLNKNFKTISVILSGIAGFFFLIAFILINSNIRLTIYSKRFIIKTMQLVGATKKFIQTPFLRTNLLLAIFACFLGNTLLLVIIIFLVNEIPEIKNLISLNQLIYLVLTISIINLMISFFSTWICVRRYLNLKVDQLYKE